MQFSYLLLVAFAAFSVQLNLFAQSSIYISGYENHTVNYESISIAKYWKDGSPVSLTNGKSNAFCRAVYVEGNDVYTAGGEKNNEGTTMPVYWKNGSPNALPLNSGSAFGNCIITKNNTVYASVESDGWTAISADYWIGNQSVKLNKPDEVVSVRSIFLDNKNHMHAAGVHMIAKGDGFIYPVAAYWLNGKETLLTDANHESLGQSIFVHESDIYIAGYEMHVSEKGSFTDGCMATYWKNGKTIHLSEPTKYHYATAVYVHNNDVYVAGYERNQETGKDIAKYWKNGKEFCLTDGSYHGRAHSIFIHNNIVYVAGEINPESDPVKLATSENGINKIAVYWKDGIMTALTDKSNDASAYGIFVK